MLMGTRIHGKTGRDLDFVALASSSCVFTAGILVSKLSSKRPLSVVGLKLQSAERFLVMLPVAERSTKEAEAMKCGKLGSVPTM